MSYIPKVACINDLSGFGRCSLTVALPILSVLSCQPCPVPTAILSKHTGYENYYFKDLTPSLSPYLKDWEDIEFQGIYTGFLGSKEQVELVEEFITSHKSSGYIVVDPVMADGGKIYSTCTQEHCNEMKRLVALSNVTTPNVTEACILAEEDFLPDNLPLEKAASLGLKINQLGCENVIITGIRLKDSIVNLVCSGGDYQIIDTAKTPGHFAGTGDIFASVLTGYLMNNISLIRSVKLAGEFVSKVTNYTLQQKANITDGVLFEPFLKELPL